VTGRLRQTLVALPLMALLFACLAAPADARYSRKKAIWGPTKVNGVSQFPIYRDLGVGIYQMTLRWNEVAPRRPRRPSNPRDAAYRWPNEVDFAIRQGRRNRIRVSLMLIGTPPWANGGRSSEWAPHRPSDFSAFARAAARRYPRVRLWQIWGEPSRQKNFKPLPRFEATGPRHYARLLDAAYASLKRESRQNLVIGGNTFTTGHVTPRQFISSMRLRNGRPPRMDMYGHNPFTARAPALRKGPLGHGYADFSDLDTLAGWIDRDLRRPGGRRITLFLSEFTIPTDHANYEFNFWVTREVQARWLRAALRITHRWERIYALGWFSLYDEPPNGPNGSPGDEVNRGLLEWDGDRKPSYRVFQRAGGHARTSSE
jgi:hypothetical protein